MADIFSAGQATALTLSWHNLRYQHTQRLVSVLKEKYAPATTNKHINALRGCLKECWKMDLIDRKDYHKAIDLKRVRATTLPKGRALAQEEITALFEVCTGDEPRQVRDRALLALLYGCGLCRAEVVAIQMEHYSPVTGQLKIISGKGNKDRTAYPLGNLKKALDRWVTFRDNSPGPLFCPVKAGRLLLDRKPLIPHSVFYILKRLSKQADLQISFSRMI